IATRSSSAWVALNSMRFILLPPRSDSRAGQPSGARHGPPHECYSDGSVIMSGFRIVLRFASKVRARRVPDAKKSMGGLERAINLPSLVGLGSAKLTRHD